jgi:hypothetical protein
MTVSLTIFVENYLRFEVSHRICPGSGLRIWTLKQFNGPAADPMVMTAKSADPYIWMQYILPHIAAEIEHYVPPAGLPCDNVLNVNVGAYSDGDLTYEGNALVTFKNNKPVSPLSDLLSRFSNLFQLFPNMS